MDKLFCRKVIFREILMSVYRGKHRSELLQVGVDFTTREVKYPVWQSVESLFFNAGTDHGKKQREVGYGPAGDKVEFLVYRFKPCIQRDDIFQSESFGNGFNHFNLLPDGVNQGKLYFGEHNGQRYPWKSSSCAGIHDGGSRFEVGKFCNGKRMEDVVNADMIDILPGYYIDPGIPFLVKFRHFCKAFNLSGI